jgi:hypothetical protein
MKKAGGGGARRPTSPGLLLGSWEGVWGKAGELTSPGPHLSLLGAGGKLDMHGILKTSAVRPAVLVPDIIPPVRQGVIGGAHGVVEGVPIDGNSEGVQREFSPGPLFPEIIVYIASTFALAWLVG